MQRDLSDAPPPNQGCRAPFVRRGRQCMKYSPPLLKRALCERSPIYIKYPIVQVSNSFSSLHSLKQFPSIIVGDCPSVPYCMGVVCFLFICSIIHLIQFSSCEFCTTSTSSRHFRASSASSRNCSAIFSMSSTTLSCNGSGHTGASGLRRYCDPSSHSGPLGRQSHQT